MGTRKMGDAGTPDPVYDLISVAYHALQGAETYEQYAQDAQQQGDQELANFSARRSNNASDAGMRLSGFWRTVYKRWSPARRRATCG